MQQYIFSLPFLTRISFAFLYIGGNGVTIYYNITFNSVCHSKEGRFFMKQGVSVTQCAEECGLRQHCEAVTYKRRTRVCELFLRSAGKVVRGGDCVFIHASDILVTEIPCHECEYGTSCDPVLQDCLQKECLNVTIPRNGEVHGNLQTVGDMLLYTCDEGYRTQNSVDNAVCNPTGQWNTSETCVLDCEKPPAIDNGQITPTDKKTASVKCDPGYGTNTTTIKCKDLVSWDNITCEPIVCDYLPAITHGTVERDSDQGNPTATLTCDVGYTPTKATIMCILHNMWESASCVRTACGYSPYVFHGTAVLDITDGIYYQDTATITCDDWYQIEKTTISCTSAGTWEPASCLDCYPAAPQEYIGRTSITRTGIQCQRWDSQSPHTHGYTSVQLFPDESIPAANNYCRVPEPGNYDPWCMTMDPETEWEYCDVPKCPWV